MNNNIISFKYSSYSSFLHKLNPCVKIALSFTYILLAFVEYSNTFLNVFSVILNIAFIIFLFIITKMNPFNIFRHMFGMRFLILLIFISNMLSVRQKTYEISIFFTKAFIIPAVLKTLKIAFRFFKVISISHILLTTTTSQEIAKGIAFFMRPLKILFKVPIESTEMMMNISISFIPIFFQEIVNLYKAQQSRGRRTDKLFYKIKMFAAIINYLFYFIFKTENDLVMVLASRGYKLNAKRTNYRKLSFDKRDIYAILFIIFLSFLFGTLKILDFKSL